jgi:hypothetical protein
MIPTTTSLTTLETPAGAAEAMTGSAVLAFLRALMTAVALIAGLISVAAGLYLVKSALGINLLPGKSPLHDLLYQFVL